MDSKKPISEVVEVCNIVIPIYEGVDLLDVTVPYEVFGWVKSSAGQDLTKVYLVGETGKPIKTRDGFVITPELSMREFEANNSKCGVLWVPGGAPQQLSEQMKNETYNAFIKRLSEVSGLVTSVCEGALLLANAGLLYGYNATTHWAFVPCLASYPGITVIKDVRFVVDGNRVTGGGVSSGLDECFQIIIVLFGMAVAEKVQQSIQYYPDPPVNGVLPTANACPLNSLNYNG